MNKRVLRRAVVIPVALTLVITLSSFIDSSVLSKNSNDSKNLALKSINGPHIIEMITKVNKTDIINYLEDFVAFGPKNHGTNSCEKCGAYIFHTFEQMGFDVEYHNWAFPIIKGKNVIATQQGQDPTSDAVFIICAHYDTADDSPGANDDGSGIAAMLTIAKILHDYRFNHTFRFIAFSGHEIGTYGSLAYAQKASANQENIIAVLNLDMIGNTTNFCKKIQIHKAQRSEWIYQFILDVFKEYQDYLPIVIEPIDGIAGADEKAFLDCGYDAILFHQPHSWLPEFHNHKPGDTIQTIDFDFLINVTKLVLTVAAELGNKPINLQIRIIEPCEGYFYSYNNIKFKLPGLNIFGKKIRGITYVQGGFTAKFNISTTEDDPIDVVYCIIDDKNYFNLTEMRQPYDIVIHKSFLICKSILTGLHTFRFFVTTNSGNTAFDEITLFLML